MSQPFLIEAQRVEAAFRTAQISLIAPDNLRYEVAGAIHRAIVARYIRAPEGVTLVERFLDLDIPVVAGSPFIPSAFSLSLRFGCSFYDALYLTLAKNVRRPFIHADENLHRVLNGRFPLELWIEDYR
jgi:predicted nucleic acid-binding protein